MKALIAGVTLCLMIVPYGRAGAQATSSSQAPSPEESSRLCQSPDPEISIAGCNAVIQSRRENGRSLAVAYVQRGTAYQNLQDFDHALQDFSEAVKLDPAS